MKYYLISILFAIIILLAFVFTSQKETISMMIFEKNYNSICWYIDNSEDKEFFLHMAYYGFEKDSDEIDYDKLVRVANYYIENGGDPFQKEGELTAYEVAQMYNPKIAEIIKKAMYEYEAKHVIPIEN